MTSAQIAAEIRNVEGTLKNLREKLLDTERLEQEAEKQKESPLSNPVFKNECRKISETLFRILRAHTPLRPVPSFMEVRTAGEYTYKGFYLGSSTSSVTWAVVTDKNGSQVLVPSNLVIQPVKRKRNVK